MCFLPEIVVESKCHDFGDNPKCLGTIDPRYTMNFDTIGQGSIYWCSYCGPIAARKPLVIIDSTYEFVDGIRRSSVAYLPYIIQMRLILKWAARYAYPRSSFVIQVCHYGQTEEETDVAVQEVLENCWSRR